MIKIKKSKKDISNLGFNLRIIFVALFVTILFGIVVYKTGVIIFVKGQEYSENAYNQHMKNQILSPKRGTIYDSEGDILAKNITVKTISLNHNKVQYYNGKPVEIEKISEGLAITLEIGYEEIYEKIKNSTSSIVVIAKKVEESKAENLEKWLSENGITTGVNIDDDTKRYYPYNNLASNLLGFCNYDNVGTTGIEDRWNSTLNGTAGKIVAFKDVKKSTISDEVEQYIPVENGKNIYLTLNISIQQIVERYLKQAVEESHCSGGGNITVMNPQTGDILAMASYPDYNLNQPYLVEPTGDSEIWNELTLEQKNTSYNKLWSNKSVSRLYEPGSTFKIITSAVALEENIIETDNQNDFVCTGSQQVEDKLIHCWRPEPHGVQSLRNALCNSCNPAFIQLGQKIGANILYKYYEALGLFDATGGKIAKSYKSVFHELSKVGRVELATISFGQRFEISPLQLITAVSAIVNDGKLVEPRVIKKIENTDTGVIEILEPKVVRQVVSEETSEKIRDMMKSVVVDGTGKRAAVEGYSIGGKSGTSEPTIVNEDQGYTASFIAVAPIDEPQVVVLIVLNDPEGEIYQGGQTAGPVAKHILTEILPLLGIPTDEEKITMQENSLLTVPNISTKTVSAARQILETYGFKVNVDTEGDENTISIFEQFPEAGEILEKGSTIYLYTNKDTARISTKVPTITGLTVNEAQEKLEQSKLNMKVEGKEGTIISQSPLPEETVEEGTIVSVVIQ